jgi:hypothetical protein
MGIIGAMVNGRVVAHNLRFDWFHLSKFYNMLKWICDAAPRYWNWCLIDFSMEDLVEAEWQSQFGPCLKPAAAVDTMLLASKGKFQSFLMDTKSIRVRRLPLGVAQPVCDQLNQRTDWTHPDGSKVLPWILFAGRKDDTVRWEVTEHTDISTGDPDPLWRDIKLSFSPSKGLKDLAVFLCGHEQPAQFKDIGPGTSPAEEGYAPFVRLLCPKGDPWLYNDTPTWPLLIKDHILHWAKDDNAQAYAEDDIVMLGKLYEYFESPDNDRDGMIACQVASNRLRGFAVDLEGCDRLLHESLAIIGKAELNVNSPKQVLGYVAQALSPMEQLILKDGCHQKVIDDIGKLYTLEKIETCHCQSPDELLAEILDELEDLPSYSQAAPEGPCVRCGGRGEVGPTGSCEDCSGSGLSGKIDKKGRPENCKRCDGSGLSDDRKMEVVRRAEHIELVRKHTKRRELFDKLLLAKRAYPDFSVIGAKSGRMSGASGLNYHGVDKSKDVRTIFTLADAGLVLSAGDYSSQELAIAATTMNDDGLMRDMESGKSLHGLFAAEVYETTYEEIMRSYEEDGDTRYSKAKGGVYAILYGGTYQTVARNMNVDEKVAEAAYNRLCAKYPQMGNTRKAVTERFSSMRQDSEGKIRYRDPPEKFIESVFGFRRYFHTEYAIQRMILDLVNNMPKEWKDIKCRVQRRDDKVQTMSGAIASALYGAAFSVQNGVIRASNNHVIQSTGRELTIGMQAEVWSIQPQGIHPFRLTLMSIHDELAVVSKAETVSEIQDTITAKVAEQCKTVPLTSIEWFTNNESWAQKGSGHNATVIGWNPDD